MLRDKCIICISSIDWDFNWQGHQEIMSTFAKNDNKVLFIENTGIRPPGIKDIPRIRRRIKNWLKGVKGIRKELDNLYIFSPLVLPFPYSWIARKVNRRLLLTKLRRWMQAVNYENPIIWTFLPTGISLDIIENLDKKLVVYYCIAKFSNLTNHPKKIKKTEKELLKKSDVVFAQGEEIKRYCQKYNDNVFVFPFGVKLEVFKNVEKDIGKEKPDDLKDIKNPIIGYVGGLHKHLDLSLIKSLAKENPDWSLVFIGPEQRNLSCLKGFNNIHILGQKNHLELPKYINRFNVSIIPYMLNDYTRTVYPAKLNEYLIMGKPVVSTDLPEIGSFNKQHGDIVYVGKTHIEFIHLIKKAIEEDNGELEKMRMDIAEENCWENRIEQMSSIIENVTEQKELEREARWKENFLNFYRAVRRRLIRVGIACSLAYLILFYSPLVWFIANPLKIAEMPSKADAIVVFAGGVGETGAPGESTLERSRYSVDLFKKGYSEIIIYSSGFTYKYNDASNMRQFALSLGVPEKNIILELKAKSAYENAKYTTQILRKKDYDKIILISSPYNMRRASLVFNHIAKDIDVVYTPVLDSQFYRRGRRVKLEQIRAIMHEYLGIIYYWWKGYI